MSLFLSDSSEQAEHSSILASDTPEHCAHNVSHSLSSRLSEKVWQLRDENLRDCFTGSLAERFIFSSLAHPLCGTLHIVNDAKSSSINATWFALAEYATSPTILLVGGEEFRTDSQVDFPILHEHVRTSVECIIAYGKVAERYFQHFSTMVRCLCVETLEQAVSTAAEYLITTDAERGASNAMILFSPSTPVAGDFINPAHRQSVFEDAVRDYFEMKSMI